MSAEHGSGFFYPDNEFRPSTDDLRRILLPESGGGVQGVAFLKVGRNPDSELVFHLVSTGSIMVPFSEVPTEIEGEIFRQYPFLLRLYHQVDYATSEILRVQTLQRGYREIFRQLSSESEALREEIKWLYDAAGHQACTLPLSEEVRENLIRENAELMATTRTLTSQLSQASVFANIDMTLFTRACDNVLSQRTIFQRMAKLLSYMTKSANLADRLTATALVNLLWSQAELLSATYADLSEIAERVEGSQGPAGPPPGTA